MKLLIATKNPGKFHEITEVLHTLPFEIVSLADIGITENIEEHGATFGENAVIKARHFYKKTGLPTVGEDSGIHVDAFPGELGVKTRRWKGLGSSTDKEWITHFLKEMENVPPEGRGAEFMCFAALILDEATFEKPHIFFGETRGIITKKLESPLKPGIPLSSCFLPEGADKVYAALSVEEKATISHRGKAIRSLRDFLHTKQSRLCKK